MGKNTIDGPKIERTLAQQMRITDFEVELRKRLFEISSDDVDILKSMGPYISGNMDSIVDEFYVGQKQNHEISQLIGDVETFRRLQGSMRTYIGDLFSGHYDSSYVNSRLRIGMVHKRIGVSSKLYIFSMHALEQILMKYVRSYMETMGISGEADNLSKYQTPLRKLLAFDLHLVIETYIRSLLDEVEAAHQKLSSYAESLEEIIADRTQQLQSMVRVDDLTGVGNRRAFFEDLRHHLALASRQKTRLSLVYFDLNSFKALNDEKGHQAGDEILRTVGRAMQQTARETDFSYRYGGDEFAAILPNTSIEEAKVFCERLIAEFDKHETQSITFSIGLVEAGKDGIYPDQFQLLKMADLSMYEVKALSRESRQHIINGSSIS